MLTARVSFVVFNGIVGTLNVLHTCDNTICVNPEHLWLGTNKDNTQDMFQKGREAPQHGTHNPMAKLNDEKVKEIKQRLANGESQRDIARSCHVCFQTINLIAVGKTWRHVNV